MKRGPVNARNGDDRSMNQKAGDAWGIDLPDWVKELARRADATGQKAAGAAINYSAATVSQVISNTYKGDLGCVEEMVRGAWMAAHVRCPVLGSIGRDLCLRHQKTPLSTANPMSVRLFHTCRNGCPNWRPTGGNHAE